MAQIFDRGTRIARTIAGSVADDDETDEDLAGLDRSQLQRLAERLGIDVGGTADDLRKAIRALVEQPDAPVTRSWRLQ